MSDITLFDASGPGSGAACPLAVLDGLGASVPADDRQEATRTSVFMTPAGGQLDVLDVWFGRPAAITVTVRGRPAPQGSKSFKGRGTSGKGVMVESSTHVKPWRTDVKGAAVAEIERLGRWHLLDGPLSVSMVFTFARPKGHWRTGRNAHLLRDSADPRPKGVPDLSKLVRSTEDALTQVVWVDDARVVDYVRLGKWYAGTDAPDVLAQGSGCVIRVWPAGAQ